MDLAALIEPPPPAELLVQTEVVPDRSVTVGELTLTLDSKFTPMRVGSPEGTTATVLCGQLEAERQHPGSDYQSTELGTTIVQRRVRLARYRWLVSEVAMEPPRVAVTVDRVAAAPKLLVPALATGEQCTFWLSTLGVDDLELETLHGRQFPAYLDYVEVTLWSYEQNIYHPWRAHLHARRVLDGYDTVEWERRIPLGQTDACSAPLGDHQIELLEVRWVSEAPADVHAWFRLSRGTTAEGMTRSPPPRPFTPHVPA